MFRTLPLLCGALLVGLQAQAQGSHQTLAALTGTRDVQCTHSVTGPDGHTVLCGNFEQTVTVGPTSFACALGHGPDAFVAKQAWGQWQWALPISGDSFTYSVAVAADSVGNTYVTGTMAGPTTFGTTVLTPTGTQDIFIAKISPGGQWLWARQMGATTAQPCYVGGLAVTPRGRVVLSGFFRGTVNLGTAAITSHNQTSPPFSPEDDAFVASLDANGNWLWGHAAGTNGADVATRVALDDAGSAYLTGFVGAGAQFDALTLTGTTGGAFVAKYDAAGTIQWVAGGDHNVSEPIDANSICVDDNHNAYVVGTFAGTIGFGPHALTSAGGKDAFVASIDPQGNWRWAQSLGGPADDRGDDIAPGLLWNWTPSPLTVVGSFQDSLQVWGQPIISAGSYDLFIGLIDPATGSWYHAYRAGGPNAELATSVSGVRA